MHRGPSCAWEHFNAVEHLRRFRVIPRFHESWVQFECARRPRAPARRRSWSRVASRTGPVRARRGSDPGPARDRSCPAAKEGRP